MKKEIEIEIEKTKTKLEYLKSLNIQTKKEFDEINILEDRLELLEEYASNSN